MVEKLILIEFLEGQGLGNQLWVYAAGRSIAEKLEVPFAVLGLKYFKGRNFLNINTQIGISEGEALEVVKKLQWFDFHEERYYDESIKYISSAFDSRVLDLKGVHKLEGLFQSEKYFFGDLEKIKKYIILEDSVKNKNHVESDTCVINLRGGEYKRYKEFILPEAYWFSAINNMIRIAGVKKFIVVTDDRRYARALFPKLEIISGDVGDCYARIYNSSHLILSNSTFSYFPIKTSSFAKLVIAPKYWARHNSKSARWASPANLYSDWLWQSNDGTLYTTAESQGECEKLETEYKNQFYIRTTLNQVQHLNIRRFIPSSIRNNIKKILAIILPKKFG